jgi:hypothetical protein
MRVVYGVEWIESEFGQRSEGFKLFLDACECIKSTRESSEKGVYAGGYLGPVRPLSMVEIPFDSLEEEYKEALEKDGSTFTSNHWCPRFKGAVTLIGYY